MVNYPVGDFLIRIKNAAIAGRREFDMESSKFVYEVAKALKRGGFLEDVKSDKGRLTVRLSYHKKEPLIIDIKIISKPGMRVYAGKREIEKKKGASVYILSTPKGVISSKEALKAGLGGELLAEVW